MVDVLVDDGFGAVLARRHLQHMNVFNKSTAESKKTSDYTNIDPRWHVLFQRIFVYSTPKPKNDFQVHCQCSRSKTLATLAHVCADGARPKPKSFKSKKERILNSCFNNGKQVCNVALSQIVVKNRPNILCHLVIDSHFVVFYGSLLQRIHINIHFFHEMP